MTNTISMKNSYFRWYGSPGKCDLLRLFGVRVCLTRWNNLAGYSRKVLGVTAFRRLGHGQIIIPLRRFKCGRKNLYLKFSWGYR